jgi:hypothetical protein
MRILVLAAFLASIAAGCGADEEVPLPDSGAAPPQKATLGWQEVYGEPGARLVFRVDSLAVEEDGWRAAISVKNDSKARFAVASGSASLDQSFGLMLLPTGDLRELDRLNTAGQLPPVRAAQRFSPPLPGVLEPGDSWSGEITARGALPGGSWARVVFGAFVAMGKAPDGLQDRVVWITDHAHRLAPGPQATSVRNSGSPSSDEKSVSPAAMSR